MVSLMNDHPIDHQFRCARVLQCLQGLSVGDAFGEQFFVPDAETCIAEQILPPPPWPWTDDTAMALSISRELVEHAGIDPDSLARRFAEEYTRDPRRGYGGGAHHLLRALADGESWRTASRALFEGQGSMGNGGGMRSAPVGAYFADDLDAVVEHATRSAWVTHAHPEGVAGAIAVAVVTAVIASRKDDPDVVEQAWQAVLDRTPDGETRQGLHQAHRIAKGSVRLAASALGTGYRVLAQDTVPFAVWCALRHVHDYQQALWETVSGLGDRDTTCAMVGGMVALAAGPEGIPTDWLRSREPLPALCTRSA